MMKTCGKCKIIKPFELFRKEAKRGYQSYCIECQKQYDYNRYKKSSPERKQYLQEKSKRHREILRKITRKIKSDSGCYFCGEKEAICLDFHHIDPSTKLLEAADMINHGHGWQKILNEIKKCAIVCSNCHRKLHAGLLNYNPDLNYCG